jgi:prevent-host-death family protein
MISVKIAELRNQLSKYLKKVRRGDEVVITDRDTPIGRLVPYEKNEENEPFEMIPPKKGWGKLSKMKFTPVKMDYDIVEDLLADRKKDALLR